MCDNLEGEIRLHKLWLSGLELQQVSADRNVAVGSIRNESGNANCMCVQLVSEEDKPQQNISAQRNRAVMHTWVAGHTANKDGFKLSVKLQASAFIS